MTQPSAGFVTIQNLNNAQEIINDLQKKVEQYREAAHQERELRNKAAKELAALKKKLPVNNA